MTRTSQRRVVALVAAGLLAVAVVVAVEASIHFVLQHRGVAQARAHATDIVARAESRLLRAVGALEDLVAAGVGGCGQPNIEAMQRAVYATTPVKEVAVVDADGAVLCSNHGFGADHKAMSAEKRIVGSDVTISVVRFGDDRELALRLRAPGIPPFLSVLVPAELFGGENAIAIGPGYGVRLMLDSVPLLVREADPPAGPQDTHVAATSTRFPFSVEIRQSISSLWAAAEIPILCARLAAAIFAGLVFTIAVSTTGLRHDPVETLRTALKAGEIIPYYQPVMDIVSGRLAGCEVLARWRKADGTLVMPSTFIPLAESTDLIFDLTVALMVAARDEVAAVYSPRPDLHLAFNIHAGHVASGRIIGDVERVFQRSALRSTQITLEVTERAPLPDLDQARQTIAELQAHGIKVAIDDVGTGHGGLNYLLKLGVDVIKIDKMFVDAIGTDRYSSAIIDTLVELGRSLDLEVVAEGVETTEQMEFLRARGVRYAQGFLFAPPLPGSAFLDLVCALVPDAGDSRAAKQAGAQAMPSYLAPHRRRYA